MRPPAFGLRRQALPPGFNGGGVLYKCAGHRGLVLYTGTGFSVNLQGAKLMLKSIVPIRFLSVIALLLSIGPLRAATL